ncbi:MAG TPA: hypothetical protein VJS43_03655 [Candidatus Acidoferrales bacterium]|nr:hypothetical protein [Candidatus Acidoferrales bacterium]
MWKLRRGIVNTIFWSYERGSWPYDVLVALILIFVLATPRSWFQDGPRPTVPASSQVQLISEDPGSNESVYRVDARLLPPDKRASKSTPELERGTHEILARTVPALQDRTFQVEKIDFVRASDGTVLNYDVTLRIRHQ